MKRYLLYTLILSIILSILLMANTDTELINKYSKKYQDKPTCSLTGIYLSLYPNNECIDMSSIQQREKDKYVINFMWINKNYSEEQKYILPNIHNEFEAEQYLGNIILWAAAANSDTLIQIWYDSATTSEKAITRTKEYLFAKIEEYLLLIGASDNAIAPIEFRDLRSLPIVEENPRILDPKLPIMLKADLMKTIIVYNDIVLEGASYSIFADMDVKPKDNKDLYDPETMKNLQEYGLVMGNDGTTKDGGMENQFQILSYHNKELLEAWGYAMITLNVARILTTLDIYEYYHDNFPGDDIRYLIMGGYVAQRVYDSYNLMFKYFLHLSGRDPLMMWNKRSKSAIPYNREKDGLKMLNLALNSTIEQDVVPVSDSALPKPQTEQGKKIKEQYEKDQSEKYIPIKDIDTMVGQGYGHMQF